MKLVQHCHTTPKDTWDPLGWNMLRVCWTSLGCFSDFVANWLHLFPAPLAKLLLYEMVVRRHCALKLLQDLFLYVIIPCPKVVCLPTPLGGFLKGIVMILINVNIGTLLFKKKIFSKWIVSGNEGEYEHMVPLFQTGSHSSQQQPQDTSKQLLENTFFGGKYALCSVCNNEN